MSESRIEFYLSDTVRKHHRFVTLAEHLQRAGIDPEREYKVYRRYDLNSTLYIQDTKAVTAPVETAV
jgi:hypothetical protein